MKEIYYLDGKPLSQLTDKDDIKHFDFYKERLKDLEGLMKKENAFIEIYKKEGKLSVSGNGSYELNKKIKEAIFKK